MVTLQRLKDSEQPTATHSAKITNAIYLPRKYLPCFIIVAFYILCILAADPRGEFPLNDDWSYNRSARAFASGQGPRVDDWSAPSLVGQAMYGGLLIKLFSPGFLVLRLSTLLLSCCTAVLLWSSFCRIGLRTDFACALLLAWIFNPLQFNLSFTFMTEIPFLFFAALAIRLYILHLDRDRTWILFLSAAACGYAFLIRQTGAFFILALAAGTLSDTRRDIYGRVRRAILAAGTGGAFVAGYYLWVWAQGGATAAVLRKFVLLDQLTARQLIGNSYGMLFYLAFMTLPIWLILIPSLRFHWKDAGKNTRMIVFVWWVLVVFAGLGWFRSHGAQPAYLPSAAYHTQMPFLLNVLYDTGLGPVTLDPDYFHVPPMPTYPRIWLAITAAVVIGTVLMSSFLTFSLNGLRTLRVFQDRKPLFVFSCLACVLIGSFEVIFGHLQEGGLFDRHILSVALPAYLLIGLLTGEKKDENGCRNRSGLFALCTAGVVLVALAIFCVSATRDYMQWNRIRWEMGRGLLQKGVSPLVVAAGFEFNAWHNYETFVKRGSASKAQQWWYDRRDYIITMRPIEGYEVLEKREFLAWVHRRLVSLYLCRKCG